MVIYLAGRAAERHVLGDDYTTSGVVGDLIGANEIAIKMSEEMLDLELLASGPISEKLASAVEEKALSLLADATGEAERVVKTYESSLLTLTEAVLMTGNLCQPEIHKILKHVEMYGPLSLKAIQFLLKKM
jgi:ATP-dependent Zn protease